MNRSEAVAALESLPMVERISVAGLKPTDVIVVNVSRLTSQEEAARMGELLKRIWPDNKVLVLEKGVEIKIADGPQRPDIGGDVPGEGAV